MPRPTSTKLTTELLDQFLTYDPKTGELRTRATRKLVDPVRPTKIDGVSVNPARAAFAMGNLYFWDKVGFKDGNPRNLRLDNLFKADSNLYVKSGKPRKPYTRKPGPDTPVGLAGLKTLEEPPSTPWQKRLDIPQTNLLPVYNTWSSFLKSHFSYDPDAGTLTIRATGHVLKATDKYGAPRTVEIPKFVDAKHKSLRIDRLAWLLATNRLPDRETTRFSSPSLHAVSIEWHPEGIPRTSARPVAKPSGGQWFAYVYHNRILTKVGSVYEIEEEALAAATVAANARMGITDQWRSGLVTLADYMARGMPDYYRDEDPIPEDDYPINLEDDDDDLKLIPKSDPTPTPVTPAPVPDEADDYVWPDFENDDDDPDIYGPCVPDPNPFLSITGEMRKPWVYTPCNITLD